MAARLRTSLLKYRLRCLLVLILTVVHLKCIFILLINFIIFIMSLLKVFAIFGHQCIIEYFLWRLILGRVHELVLGMPRIPLDQVYNPSQ